MAEQLAALAEMPLAFAEALAPHLATATRLAARDDRIRVALTRFYSSGSKTAAAKGMAADLDAGPIAGTQHGDALLRILALNCSRPLRYRQILEIADGWRGH